LNVLIYFIEIEPNSEHLSKYLVDTELTWPEVEDIWIKTVNFRQYFIYGNNTKTIFDKWQHYTKLIGYKLLSSKYY
jgi:hypothetical protein